MCNKKAYINISKLYTLAGGVRIQDQLDDCAILEDAYLITENDKISETGYMKDLTLEDDVEVLDCKNKIITPGFIDAHSHLVFSGNRVNEYAMKIKGASYMDIYHAGGGIHSTVRATRNASFDELYERAKKNILEMMSNGVTTLEAKSGYGLDKDTELKQLRVVKKLNKDLDIDLVSTFMPGHALSREYKDAYEYFDMINQEVLPIVMEENLAEYMDCFLEKGVFDKEESLYSLKAGKEAGLKIKIHVDEIEDINGVDAGVEMQAVSLEHCMVTKPENMDKMAKHGIVAVILPATSFNLVKPFANVKTMKEKGVIIALSNDFNPGSSPCTDSIWMARIASRGLRLTPNEVLSMMTINSAKALNRDHIIGSLEKGKQADFLIINALSFDEIIANLTSNPIDSIIKKGKKVCL